MRLSAISVLLASSVAFAAGPLPANLFDQLQWRNIGPWRGGRVVAVAGIPGNSATFYFGSVGGGVWKTTNGGMTWSPIFDSQTIASIGAIAAAPSSPDTIYVGSGEADMRSDISFGDGVYKSTDAGRTWRNVGLRDSRQIAKILVDPRNPDVVYVAAAGHGYGPNAERGVYKSTDGGATWRRTLDNGPEIGAVDLTFDPANSATIYTTVWHGQRPPWSVYGPLEGKGGLYKSTDAGEHWSHITGHGLPESEWRRAGVTAGPRNVVYVNIDADSGSGIYRSENGGDSWTRATGDSRVSSRGWYFSGITVDPRDPNLVYVPNVATYRSTDGGRNFTVLKGAPGGDDYHVLWIDPTEPSRMILGSDQGTNISVDKGATWSTWYNQPTAQFYHVITDNKFPYWVYGSQQDSGTAAVASQTDYGEIDARHWTTVGGAEAGYIAIDTKDSNIFYVGDTNGTLTRFDRRTNSGQNITPGLGRGVSAGGDVSTQKYRFPWTAPLVTSPLEPGVVYYGSQFLLKTTDQGLTWKEISPDLTGDTRKEEDKSAPAKVPVTPENAKELGYGVLWTIAPSPVAPGLIWTGSDTGMIHITRDAGKTWSNVTPPAVTPWSNVTHIEASRFEAGTAWAAVDRHHVDDLGPYLYRTRDFGKTWQLVTDGMAAPAWLNAIREDPKRKGLLYACTELAVFVSFDDGDHWQSLKMNMPAVSIRDLVVHGDDLVIATHGRGFWILDNMSLLREISEKTATEDAVLFRTATAIRLNPEAFMGTPFPVEEPKSKNPPHGAILDYYLKSAADGEVTLEILNPAKQVVRRFSIKDSVPTARGPLNIADVWVEKPAHLSANAGHNRFVWDLRHDLRMPAGAGGRGGAAGPHAAPGTYTVRLTAGGKSYTQPLKVVADPRSITTPAEFTRQQDFGLSVTKAMAQISDAVEEIAAFRKKAAERGNSSADAAAAGLAGSGGGGRGTARAASGPTLLSVAGELNSALGFSESADRTPPATAYALYDRASKSLTELLAQWKKLKDSSGF